MEGRGEEMIVIPLKIKLKFNKRRPSIQNNELIVHLSAKMSRLSKFWMNIIVSINCLIIAFKCLIKDVE